MAYNDPQSWSHSLILRGITLLFNILCVVLLGVGFAAGSLIHLILFSIVGVWSLVEFVLLLCKCNHHPGVNVGLDLVSFLIFIVMSVIGLGFFFVDFGFIFENISVMRAAVVLNFVSTLCYLVIFVRACIHTHQKRQESKRSDWETNKTDQV